MVRGQVQGNMHSPLRWNADRQWRFGVSLRQPVLYLLRDHINMLTDLSKDWTSGPPSNYFTWVPMRYAVDLDLRNYEINTYVNDQNIIDKPLIRDENGGHPDRLVFFVFRRGLIFYLRLQRC